MAGESASNPKIAAGVQGQSTEVNDEFSDSSSGPSVDKDVSPGVARVAAINRNMTRADRIRHALGGGRLLMTSGEPVTGYTESWLRSTTGACILKLISFLLSKSCRRRN